MPLLTTGAGAYPAAGAAFTPASLTGLKGWYKADAGVFSDAGVTPATNGGTVQQWNDQSGVGNHLSQATSGDRPTYTTNSLNSLPTIDNGSTKYMKTGSAFAMGGTTVSIFAVIKATATSAGRMAFFSAGSDTSSSAWLIYYASLTNPTCFNAGNLSNGTVSSGAWNEIGAIWDGANNTMYINGTGQTPAASSPTFDATGTMQILTSDNLANSLGGSYAELVITSTALNGTDRSNMHTYFLNKWGV